MTRPSSSPRAIPEEAEDPAAAGRDRRVTRELEADDRRVRRVVYVIDDSEDARELLAEALHDAGYRVLEARNGREALGLLLDLPTPAAIVLDLLMPVMDGHELLDVLGSYVRLTRVPTLVVTASDDDIEVPIPFARCLRKPLDAAAVVETLEELIAAAQTGGR
jgi:CheY-like chemotaxis protein